MNKTNEKHKANSKTTDTDAVESADWQISWVQHSGTLRHFLCIQSFESWIYIGDWFLFPMGYLEDGWSPNAEEAGSKATKQGKPNGRDMMMAWLRSPEYSSNIITHVGRRSKSLSYSESTERWQVWESVLPDVGKLFHGGFRGMFVWSDMISWWVRRFRCVCVCFSCVFSDFSKLP